MTIDLGLARALDSQAFGQPGQRTFRLRIVGASGATASLWMEKEHIQALTLAIRQMLAQLEYGEETPPPPDVGEFPASADHDFRIGRMGMGFDRDERSIVLYTYEIGVEDDENPTLRVRMTQEQSASLAAQLDEIISGGRPLCPLCGVAMDAGGHMCVRANGHSKQPIPEEQEDEESG